MRPYAHKILVVIEPLLIDEDYYARIEGREIISNLAKAAGLATMIATMRPDIDHPDEYVRNTTARYNLGLALLLTLESGITGGLIKRFWPAVEASSDVCRGVHLRCSV